MREGLRPFNRKRMRFTATVSRFGSRTNYAGGKLPTILLQKLRLEKSKKVLADHIWLTSGKWSKQLNVGDTFSFDARVTRYEKGYKGFRDHPDSAPIEDDYRLDRPTRIQVLQRRRSDGTR